MGTLADHGRRWYSTQATPLDRSLLLLNTNAREGWSGREISLKTKGRIFEVLVRTIHFHGCET